jgi:CubicO group peptidase (beta-lactamase class C family)
MYDTASPKVDEHTVYDIASVTKSIPVSSLILQLIEQGKLHLDQKVIDFIPELQNAYRQDITITHLLSYTVIFDLPQGLSVYGKQGADAVLQAIFKAPLQAPPGEKYYYTNTPALLLGLIVERCTRKALDVLAQEVFFGPLGMTRTTFFPEDLQEATIAPTEEDWRGLVHGKVHDEAAWALRASNIIAGNAGLFSTAHDLAIFCQMLLEQGTFAGRQYFTPETVRQMHTNQIAHLQESAGLGWELHQSRFMGDKASTQCFGKTGFTGTFVLIDPLKQSALVLLSNRIHPKRPPDREAINAVRRAVANLIFA